MGSGYNDSLAVSRGARGKASTRTPIHFYLDVPMYEYDLGCGRNEHLHTFQSRTPLITDDETVTVWCSGCQEFRELSAKAEPLNRVVSADETIAFEQDKGILRERIALAIQDMGFVEDEADVLKLAVKFGVKTSEVKRINAGLRAPEGLSGLPDMCSKNLHEMTMENIMVSGGRRQCKACYNIARRANRAKKRDGTATPGHNRRR
jgi:hypothetical protein